MVASLAATGALALAFGGYFLGLLRVFQLPLLLTAVVLILALSFINFRGNICVVAACGETRPAAEWVGKGGRARKLPGARVTARGSLRHLRTVSALVP